MPWEGKRQLPPNWKTLRRQCRDKAGGRCEAIDREGQRCNLQGNEAHHPDPLDHGNLIWLCAWHHNRETQRQAQEAKRRKKELEKPKHPGLK